MEWTECDDAFADLPAGTRFVAGNVTGTPNTLLAGLARRAETVGNLHLRSGLLLGDVPLEQSVRSGALSVRSWHVHGPLRALYREGLIDYTPVRLLDIPEVILDDSDVALVRVGPPDDRGQCTIGPSASYTREAVERVSLVIAEVSDNMPRTYGDSTIPTESIDRFVLSMTALPSHHPGEVDDVSRAIAEHVLRVLPRGATLQLGIGTVPEALADELARRKDLEAGLVGLVTDAMMPLVDRIAQRGGTVTAVELMGTPEFMRWADDHPGIRMADSQHLHNPLRLAEIPNLVSVNSAVAVDTMGQVIAESVAGSVIAGVGGSADFAEGAHLSPGGLRIIALPSTTKRGQSTIVPHHDPRDSITAAHHSVDIAVTEHGAAHLRGASRRERRERLIAIASPEKRDELRG